MDKTESLNHTKWECKYHVVFIPKGSVCRYVHMPSCAQCVGA